MIGGVMIGLSKTAIPGLGMASIPLIATVLPARSSTGIVLILLIFADIFAVLYYRRQALWMHLARLIPWAFMGIIAGYFMLGKIDDRQLKYAIGCLILAMLALNYWREKRESRGEPPGILCRWWFAAFLGLVAGAATMMANAAGPILVVYLIAMRVPKNKFIGTAAWYFFILNWVKVPFSMNLGFINGDSMKLTFYILPSVAAGAVGGIFILKKIPEKAFNKAVKILTAAAALKLFT
ncbi:MAG TPA: sulfite exporter TauE/SafE family protein [bacterium]|nr:sulfite exporter TauE/SafE family protein [bacterium]